MIKITVIFYAGGETVWKCAGYLTAVILVAMNFIAGNLLNFLLPASGCPAVLNWAAIGSLRACPGGGSHYLPLPIVEKIFSSSDQVNH